MSILVQTDESIIIENALKYKVEFIRNSKGFHKVRLSHEDVYLGEVVLLKEDRATYVTKESPYRKTEPLNHSVLFEEVLEDNAEKTVLSFFRISGYLKMKIIVTLSTVNALEICYELNPADAFEDMSEQMYTKVSFEPENSSLGFVQSPFHAPIVSEEEGGWEIHTPKYFVPFMFSKRNVQEKELFLGVGYHLDNKYSQGKLGYEHEDNGGYFKVFPINLLPQRRRVCTYTLFVSFGKSQQECIGAYQKVCGYSMEIKSSRKVDESIDMFVDVYKKSNTYLEGKGYYQQVDFNSGQHHAEGYGRYITVCSNLGLAYNLYRYSQEHQGNEFLVNRAVEMVDFFMESQDENGGVPNLYYPEQDRYLTYIQFGKESRNEYHYDTEYLPKADIIYTTHMMAMACYYLYRFSLDREKNEGCDMSVWKESAKKAMAYLMDKVKPDGLIGRDHCTEGEYDDICANVWFLIALDYFYDETGDEKYDACRQLVEGWVDRVFASTNHWFNWSADGGCWQGADSPHINHDAFEVPTYATYCMYRYLKTKDVMYINRSKDTLAYLWLCMVPVQYSGYERSTKGLVKEQDTYRMFDVPFNTIRLFDCLPLLSTLTDDSYFMEFYKFVTQVQLSYQAVDKDYKAFYIGLDLEVVEGDEKDKLGEENFGYISEFAGVVFLDSMFSGQCYSFAGGRDWCSGLDFDPQFKPAAKDGEPFIALNSCEISNYSWDASSSSLQLKLNGKIGRKSAVGFKFAGQGNFTDESFVRLNGDEKQSLTTLFNEASQCYEIAYDVPENQQLIFSFEN